MSHNRSAHYGFALQQQSGTTLGLSRARRRLVSVALPSPDGDTGAQRPLAASKAPTHGGGYLIAVLLYWPCPLVSIMSDNGVTIEQIADQVGHRTTIAPQKVYRHQLKPVISTGATAMNTIFGNKKTA